MRFFSLLSFAALYVASCAANGGSISVVVDKFSCSKFDVSGASVVVSDDGKVTVTGSVGFPSGLDDGKVKIKIKKGILFNLIKVGNYEVEADFCEGAESSNGEQCPEEGTYTVETDIVTIPSRYLSFAARGGDLFLYISDKNGDYGRCMVGLAVDNSSASVVTTSMSVLGVLGAFTAAGILVRRRSRNVATASSEEENEPQTNFEMMQNNDALTNGKIV